MTEEYLFLSVQRIVRRIVRNRRGSSALEKLILSEGEQAVAEYPSVSFSGASQLAHLISRRIMHRLNSSRGRANTGRPRVVDPRARLPEAREVIADPPLVDACRLRG